MAVMTFCMTAVTDTFTCVSLFKVRRTNISGSHWQMEKQGHLTGNSCHSHLLPKFCNYRESPFWGHLWGANTSFPSQLSGRYSTTGTTVCFVRMWMLPALNPRRKAVSNCNCSTTCKENCSIHDSQNGAKVQLPEWVPGSFCLLHASKMIRPKSAPFWRLLRRYLIQGKILKSRKFCSTNDFSINPERFFFQFVVCPYFTIPLGMIHISSLIPGLKNLSLYFKR